jgi:membrane protein
MTSEATKPTSASPGVAQTLAAETRRKRRLIGSSLWPKARLFAEILYHELWRDRTFTEASALTYKTLFSLVPIFVLTLLVLSTISAGGGGGAGEGKNALDRIVKKMIFEQLSLNTLPMVDDQGKVITKVTRNGQERQMMLSDFIEPLLERAKDSVTNPATGWIAFIVLLYGAVSLMIVIEESFNQIYGAAESRPWRHRILLYWCVLTLGPIGAGASFVLGNSAYLRATHWAGIGPEQWILVPAQIISGITISFVVVLLMFKLVPNTRVKWRSAFIGALLAAFLWELCKWAFGVYVQVALRGSWYGSLALLPIFMLWIYLTWCSILIGLHVAYMHQFYPLLKRRYFFTRAGATALSDMRWVLAVGVLLFKRFKEGKPTQAHEASDALMLPADITTQLLESLHSAGIAHVTRNGGYILARPPEAITAFDLLVAARALFQIPPELTKVSPAHITHLQTPALAQLESVESNWAKSHTLPQLAQQNA